MQYARNLSYMYVKRNIASTTFFLATVINNICNLAVLITSVRKLYQRRWTDALSAHTKPQKTEYRKKEHHFYF